MLLEELFNLASGEKGRIWSSRCDVFGCGYSGVLVDKTTNKEFRRGMRQRRWPWGNGWSSDDWRHCGLAKGPKEKKKSEHSNILTDIRGRLKFWHFLPPFFWVLNLCTEIKVLALICASIKMSELHLHIFLLFVKKGNYNCF